MKCDGCTFCCQMIEVPWLNKPAGVQCEHADPGNGCKLWPNPPGGCKDFACMYRMTDIVGVKFRPDQCGVAFEKIDDDIVLGTLQIKLLLHREKQAQRLSLDASKQVDHFRKLGLSVVLSAPGVREKTVFPGPGLSARDVQVRVEKILEGLHDCT